MAAPTYYGDIKPLFTQWERIKMGGLFDLWSYDQVKAHAGTILLALQPDPKQPNTGWSLYPGVHVMPLITGQWPQAQIDLFNAWIKGGLLEGPAPVVPVETSLLPDFIALSEALTGFDDLHTNKPLAQTYLDALLAGDSTGGITALLTAQKGLAATAYAGRAAKLGPDIGKNAAAQAITSIWYNAGFNTGGWFTLQPEQRYIYGLVWRAISAHPMGYATENVPNYWKYEPQGRQFTGDNSVVSGWPTGAPSAV
jgi:hypothetical protein